MARTRSVSCTAKRVEVWKDDSRIAVSPLVAAATITEPGLLGKLSWYARTTLDNLWGLVS